MRAHHILLFITFATTCLAPVAKADVLLTFDVGNVMRNDCAGLMQPTCAKQSTGSFSQQLRLNGALLGAPSNLGSGTLLYSEAFFSAPLAQTATPFSSVLKSRLSGPVTSSSAFTQADSMYDGDSGTGQSFALLTNDQLSDTVGADGTRSQQEYKLSYNVWSDMFSAPGGYIDLTNASLYDFFSLSLGKMIGSFDELGVASALDPLSLAFTNYDFSEITGDVSLTDVSVVPEPGNLALILLGLAALVRVRAARR